MATRFNAKNMSDTPTGYNNQPATDFTIPPCGIEDVDVGVFKLFEEELRLACMSDDEKLVKVPVVFATGEKWAMLKRNEPLRDSTNTLILPIIAITRTGIAQTSAEDIVGRGVNQQVGELVIKTKLTEGDRNYQSLINRLLLKNQLNLAVDQLEAIEGQISTGRRIGSLAENDDDVYQGGLLKQNRLNNVWEIITIPTPQYFTATYEIMFWTQYTTHMNQLIETFVASMLPWGQCWRIESPKGYWFVAKLEDGGITNESNFQEVDGERIVKWKVVLKVPAYIIASSNPSAPVAVRRYVSSPMISFTSPATDPMITTENGTVSSPYLGDDDPTLPSDISGRAMRRTDMRRTNAQLQYTPIRTDEPHKDDPALELYSRGRKPARYVEETFVGADGRKRIRYHRVSSVNQQAGETTYTGDWNGLVVVVED